MLAKDYLKKQLVLIEELEIETAIPFPIAVKHFFSRAALYENRTICASWSPADLAFRLSEQEAAKLIASCKAKPL